MAAGNPSLYGGSGWLPPANYFNQQMTGNDNWGALTASGGADALFGKPGVGNAFGNMMAFGPGPERMNAQRGGGLAQAQNRGTAVTQKGREMGAAGQLQTSQDFAKGVGQQEKLNMDRSAAKDSMYNALIEAIYSMLIGPGGGLVGGQGAPSLGSQFMAGGGPSSGNIGSWAANIGPGGSGLTGLINSYPSAAGAGAGAGALGGLGAVGGNAAAAAPSAGAMAGAGGTAAFNALAAALAAAFAA